MRAILLLAHRYVGLLLAAFLVLAALTGSVLVWYQELDALFHPARIPLQQSASHSIASDPLVLRQSLLDKLPGAQVSWISLSTPDHQSAAFFIDNAAPGQDDEYWLDPATGKIIASRRWGDLSQGLKNLIPFLYQLHYSLALGELGTLLMGLIGLLWTVDCFVGAALTFPRPSQNPRPAFSRIRQWFQRWIPSWLLSLSGGPFRVIFTFHRAAGLWIWALLFIFAWSAVGFNLRNVYHPVMRVLFDYQQEAATLPNRPAPTLAPMSWENALQTGRQLIALEAAKENFNILHEDSFSFDTERGVFRLEVCSSRDLSPRRGRTTIVFDAVTGDRLESKIPTGKTLGDTMDTWLFSLHLAQVSGLPYRVFVTLLGPLVSTLAITGVLLWLRKRRARRRPAHRQTVPPP
jgi:uncharacterized iron-regulated membrane protein